MILCFVVCCVCVCVFAACVLCVVCVCVCLGEGARRVCKNRLETAAVITPYMKSKGRGGVMPCVFRNPPKKTSTKDSWEPPPLFEARCVFFGEGFVNIAPNLKFLCRYRCCVSLPFSMCVMRRAQPPQRGLPSPPPPNADRTRAPPLSSSCFQAKGAHTAAAARAAATKENSPPP